MKVSEKCSSSKEKKNNNIESYLTMPFSFYKGNFILYCDKAQKIMNERNVLLGLSDADNLSLRREGIEKINCHCSSNRDFKWFIYRLRISTLFRLINNKVNNYLYVKRYKNLIGDK